MKAVDVAAQSAMATAYRAKNIVKNYSQSTKNNIVTSIGGGIGVVALQQKKLLITTLT